MKIKALIITAALVVASVASSMAQVYSANAVGYVNMSLPAGLSLIANPLNNGDNNLNTILPLPDEAIGTTIFRFNATAQNYGEAAQWIPGLGWFTTETDPNWLVLAPGEGFFIQCLAALNVTFVGDVPQGNLSNPMPGGFNLSIRSSQVPQEAPIGHLADTTGAKSGLEFPALTGDTLFLWDVTAQSYVAWQYLDGLGWLEGANIVADGPTIPVGSAFFVQKTGDGTQNWTRTFSVN
jgi:hypothetical protein